MAPGLYANAVGFRVGVADFALFLATNPDPGKRIDAASADVSVSLSPTTAKLLATTLMNGVAAHEEVSGGAIPTNFHENAERQLTDAIAGMGGVELRRGGDADGAGLQR